MTVDVAGTGLTQLVPEIWSGRFKAELEKEHIAAKLVNRDYEGDIKKMGDTVHVHGLEPITITDYNRTNGLGDPEFLTSNRTTLTIAQGKAFQFIVDDIDKAQQNPKIMGEAMKKASYHMADIADAYILGLYGGAHDANKIGSDAAPVDASATTYDFYALLVELRRVLNKQNVPTKGRFVVVDPDVEARLLLDQRFAESGTPRADEVTGKGFIKNVAGFDLYVSNNAPVLAGTTGSVSHVIAGTKEAITYAEQLTKVESVRSEHWFGDIARGLHVYDAMVFRPECLAVAHLDLGGDFTA